MKGKKKIGKTSKSKAVRGKGKAPGGLLARETALIAKIGRIIGSSLKIEALYEDFATEARKLIPCDRITISLGDPQDAYGTIKYVSGIPVEGRGAGDDFLMQGSITAEIVHRRSGWIVPARRIGKLQLKYPVIKTHWQAGLRSFMYLPLFSREALIGQLAFFSRQPGRYKARDRNLAQSIADQIAGAIANAQIFAEHLLAQEALKESEGRYRTLVEAAGWAGEAIIVVGNADGREASFLYANEAAVAILGCSLEELRRLTWIDFVHPSCRAAVRERYRRRFAGERLPELHEIALVAKDGRELTVETTAAFTEYQRQPCVVGFFRDITQRKQAEERLLDTQRQLKELSSRILAAQESERKRIAQELHDSLATQLAAVKYALERKLGQVGQGPPVGDSITLEEIIHLLRLAIEETRRIMANLRPSILDDLGILPTLSWYFREFQKTYPGIVLRAEILIEEEMVPEPVKVVIFRILQGALGNAAEHSLTESIDVGLREKGGWICLTVRDRGRGFDLHEKIAADKGRRGLGLASMRERAEFSGGSFLIDSRPGEGTVIEACWPLAPAGAGAKADDPPRGP